LLGVLQAGGPRPWIGFGLLAGLGLENKHSTAFFGFAVLVALLLSPERRLLRTAWPWVAGCVAFFLFLPNLVWQSQHAFATLEDLRDVSRMGKNVVLGPVAFVAQQIVILHPVLFPLCVCRGLKAPLAEMWPTLKHWN
jgi:4-amino-4-deoxy-L-arabinose transferase-like glycosyltransferase